ncbi:HdeA family protein [Microbacteriaceae bacterium K1510]|nr:HdeA family protein [Microbacteriaceae bacterium K1510]
MKYLLLTGLMIVAALDSSHAQVTVDVTKITCRQFLLMRNAEALSYWLSGYFHGRRGDTIVDTEALKSNMKTLRNECHTGDHMQSPIMQIIESSIAKR